MTPPPELLNDPHSPHHANTNKMSISFCVNSMANVKTVQ
jgi:hypothetical protein